MSLISKSLSISVHTVSIYSCMFSVHNVWSTIWSCRRSETKMKDYPACKEQYVNEKKQILSSTSHIMSQGLSQCTQQFCSWCSCHWHRRSKTLLIKGTGHGAVHAWSHLAFSAWMPSWNHALQCQNFSDMISLSTVCEAIRITMKWHMT